MRSAIVLGVLVALVGTARADDDTDAEVYAHSSATLYLASTWSPGPTVPMRGGVDGALRIQHRHLALEGRLGLGGAGSIIGLGGQVVGRLGGSAGYALPLGGRVVVVPMAAYDVFVMWEHDGPTIAVHYVTAEVPVAILINSHAVIEPFVQIGLARYQGANDLAVVVGPRIGLVF